jgi:hypothetical protein
VGFEMTLNSEEETRLGIASMFVALARTIGEKDESFLARFDSQIQVIYRTVSDYPTEAVGALQILEAARRLIRQT